MTADNLITLLRGNQLPQYAFRDIERIADAIVIDLRRREDAPYVCAACGQATFFHYDTQPAKVVEDLAIGPYRLYWRFAPRRIRCPHCGEVHVEQIRGLTPHSRQTDRLRYVISEKCAKTSVCEVARQYGLNEATVRRIDREFLCKRSLITPERKCRILGIDEIALRKGHVYATVFYDQCQRNVISMVQGRDKAAVYGFFRSMGKAWCEAVEIVTADLWRAYKTAIRKFLPNARIVTDKFHVCKYAADALDEVRRSEYNRQADRTDFDLKRGRFLLQKASAKLDERGKARIGKLKEINEDVYTAYLLKEQVFTFYEQANRDEAETFLRNWASACVASGLSAFVKLGRRLLRNAESILGYFVHRVSNAFAEGINNGIKVVKRMAFGFHDFEYFKLKILAYTGYLRPYPAPNLFCDD